MEGFYVQSLTSSHAFLCAVTSDVWREGEQVESGGSCWQRASGEDWSGRGTSERREQHQQVSQQNKNPWHETSVIQCLVSVSTCTKVLLLGTSFISLVCLFAQQNAISLTYLHAVPLILSGRIALMTRGLFVLILYFPPSFIFTPLLMPPPPYLSPSVLLPPGLSALQVQSSQPWLTREQGRTRTSLFPTGTLFSPGCSRYKEANSKPCSCGFHYRHTRK